MREVFQAGCRAGFLHLRAKPESNPRTADLKLGVDSWSRDLEHFSFSFGMYIGVKEVEQCNSRIMLPLVLLTQ